MERSATFTKYLNPWRFKREQAARLQRIDDLRKRDGDNCQRCRRPLRFDLPAGHDQAPVFYEADANASEALLLPPERQVLVHVRCNTSGSDNTAEVTERVRRRNEAALFSSNRKRA